MLREESDGFFNIRAVSFLTVALVLTVFSVAYGNWYYTQITGFATTPHACEMDSDCGPGQSCDEYVCVGSPTTSDNSPPTQVVEQVSENVETVSQSSSYAESIGEIVETQTVSESDLIRYKSNLEDARRIALEAYEESYDASSKYSSSLLSEYQESISVDLANIDRQLRSIDSLLTDTVEERFEKQTKLAVWTLEREEELVEASSTLEGYASLLPSGPLTDSSLPGTGTFNIVVINPNPLTIARGESGSGEVIFRNLGSQVNSCYVRTSGYNDWVDFYEGNYISTLPSLEERAFVFNLNVPANVEPGTYFFELVLTCGQGTVSGTTYHFEVEFSYDDLVERFYSNHVIPNLNPALGEEGMIPPCAEEVQSCFSNTGGQSVCPNYILQCILEDNCSEFLFECFYGDGAISYSNEQYYEFLNTYFTPYSETYQFTPQCTEDVVLCNEDHENCPAYISLCIAEHETGQPAHPQCALTFLETCSNGVAPSYSEMRTEFIQNHVTPYYSLPQTCLQGVSASVDPYSCYNNYLDYYSCIIYQEYGSELGGSCSNYLSNCQGTVYGTSSGGSSGGSSGSSGSLGNIPSAPTTTTGTTGTSEGGISGLCRGDETCIALSETCLYPSYIASVGLNLVDFGGFGYNPVTGEICYVGSSKVYLSNPFGRRPGGEINAFPGGDNSGNSNQVISIHFQNSGSEGDGRNYVAAMLYSLNGHLTLNFLSSPDYAGLEDKIYKFIENLLYGTSGGSYITGMSLQQAEEIVNQSASVPWVLWIILFVMVISFLFFGDLLSPYNVRLISSGKKALNKKDYALAVQNYNSLASSYAYDLDVKQDALNYLKDIREKVGSGKIDLEFSGKDALPKIKTGKFENIFSNYHRVQKMIGHALQDIKKSPKLAKSRMPVISEEYRRLSSKDKEKLASQYESLVYRLRNLD